MCVRAHTLKKTRAATTLHHYGSHKADLPTQSRYHSQALLNMGQDEHRKLEYISHTDYAVHKFKKYALQCTD